MIAWVRMFLTDERFFVLCVRGVLTFFGAVQVAGALPDTVPRWVGAVAMGAAVMFPAGEKNTPKD